MVTVNASGDIIIDIPKSQMEKELPRILKKDYVYKINKEIIGYFGNEYNYRTSKYNEPLKRTNSNSLYKYHGLMYGDEIVPKLSFDEIEYDTKRKTYICKDYVDIPLDNEYLDIHINPDISVNIFEEIGRLKYYHKLNIFKRHKNRLIRSN